MATASALVPVWQIALAAALAGWRLAWGPVDGWSRGTVPVLPTALAAAVTPGALLGWYLALRPDLSDVVATYLATPVPAWALALGAVGFALGNAALEEAVWRGVMQEELGALFGWGPAIALQAASFGLAHAHGFPRGAVGVALAGGWAVLLGLVRYRSGGILAPWLAHVVADSVIAGIVLVLVAP